MSLININGESGDHLEIVTTCGYGTESHVCTENAVFDFRSAFCFENMDFLTCDLRFVIQNKGFVDYFLK